MEIEGMAQKEENGLKLVHTQVLALAFCCQVVNPNYTTSILAPKGRHLGRMGSALSIEKNNQTAPFP